MSNNEFFIGEEDNMASCNFNLYFKEYTKPNITNCDQNPLPTLDCSEPIVRRRPLSLRIILRRCSAEKVTTAKTQEFGFSEGSPLQIHEGQFTKIPQQVCSRPWLSILSMSKQSFKIQRDQNIPQLCQKNTTILDLSCGGWESTSELSKASLNMQNCRSGMHTKRMSFCKLAIPSGDS